MALVLPDRAVYIGRRRLEPYAGEAVGAKQGFSSRSKFSVAAFACGKAPCAGERFARLDRADSVPVLVGERLLERHPVALVSACPGSTSRFTSPIANASSADTGRPVRIRSSARLSPISLGRRIVPPSTSGTPKRRLKTPKTALRAATRRSHHSASSKPPATA